MELTPKEKLMLNCLFQVLIQKGKAKSIIEVKKAVEDIVKEMNGLMQFDGAMFEHAKDNGVEKEFQDKIMEEEINLKNEENEETPEKIESKPTENEKPVKKMENQNEENQVQTFDLSKIPTTQEQLDAKRKIEEENKPKNEKLLIKGDAIIKSFALEVGTKDQLTKNGNVYRDYLLAITYKACDGSGEVTERYAGVTGWLNNGILSDPQFDSTRGTKVASIFKEFVEVSGINPDEIDMGLHLGLLLKYLGTNPKVQLKPKPGKFTNSEGKTIEYTKNEIIQFYK